MSNKANSCNTATFCENDVTWLDFGKRWKMIT